MENDRQNPEGEIEKIAKKNKSPTKEKRDTLGMRVGIIYFGAIASMLAVGLFLNVLKNYYPSKIFENLTPQGIHSSLQEYLMETRSDMCYTICGCGNTSLGDMLSGDAMENKKCFDDCLYFRGEFKPNKTKE